MPARASADTECGTFLIRSGDMTGDRRGRVSIDSEAAQLAGVLRQCCLREVGFKMSPDVIFAASGGCEIDCNWSGMKQFGLLCPTGDPRLDWLNTHTEEVEMIRLNAHQLEPKRAEDLGIGSLAFHQGLARINDAGYSVQLILTGTGRRIPVPLATAAELSVLHAGEDRIRVVDNSLLAVGGDEHGVVIFVRGHNKPLYIETGDADALHELRKKGAQVRGKLQRREKREYLIDPIFAVLPEQRNLI